LLAFVLRTSLPFARSIEWASPISPWKLIALES
jgi:hypothetical protein